MKNSLFLLLFCAFSSTLSATEANGVDPKLIMNQPRKNNLQNYKTTLTRYQKNRIYYQNFQILRRHSDFINKTLQRKAELLRVDQEALLKYREYLLHCGKKLPISFSLTADHVTNFTSINELHGNYMICTPEPSS